jgi:hypothetical protein
VLWSRYKASGIFFGFHPHLHVLSSEGCFHNNGMFAVSPATDTKTLEQLFRHKVLKMLLAKSKITHDMITLLDKWRHTGFNVYCAPRILTWHENSMENLARNIIRASFSQQRMTYHRKSGQLEYKSKDGRRQGFSTHCNDSLACAVTCPLKANRWPDTMATTAMWRAENEKKADADDKIPFVNRCLKSPPAHFKPSLGQQIF